ncbi:unnamed protein product [Strongylus vulgaris]|uniref:Uncharacterized protein n=1 Tax=Strongylus vulgaris TaxID=40348 RepID=A0A3P7K3M2_STRVU|nr:unnamed protein product [Strongylus vulgaris]
MKIFLRCVLTTVDPQTGKKDDEMQPLKKLRQFRLAPAGPMRQQFKDSPIFGVNAGVDKPVYLSLSNYCGMIDDKKLLIGIVGSSIIAYNAVRYLYKLIYNEQSPLIPVGTVKALYVYPVKSCKGKKVSSAFLNFVIIFWLSFAADTQLLRTCGVCVFRLDS